MNTHGKKIHFGKHKGELFTRLPISYLKWMINNKTEQHEIAAHEFDRRGCTMPVVELSGHAIDNASIRVLKHWQESKEASEGIYSWLQRMTLEAIDQGDKLESGKIKYNGMKFVIEQGAEFPVLKTIMGA